MNYVKYLTKVGVLSLFQTLEEKAFNFTTEYNIDCEFFIYSQIISVHNSLEKFLLWKSIGFCQMLFFFFASIEKIVPFFLHSVNVVYPRILVG